MDHLWVGIELLPTYSVRRTPWQFRFQKRVSGRSPPPGLPSKPDSYNVGHYSVRPDFGRLLSLPEDQVVPYVLDLLLESFDELGTKPRLKGFDIASFKAAFVAAAKSLRESPSANGA